MLTLINIIGYGRSGSTLLDILLGNEPGVVGCGELNKLAGQVWPNREVCGCGVAVPDCPFWADVIARFQASPAVESVDAYAALQKNVDGIANWWGVKRGHPTLTSFRQQTAALFEAIAAVSGDSILVDSSKSPTWGLALHGTPGIRIVYIHLIRDGRSVLTSLQKPYATDEAAGFQKTWKPPSPWKTALAWRLHNRLAEKTRHHTGAPSLQLRYEDLVADPEAAIASIASATGVAFPVVLDKLSGDTPFHNGHTVAGNALRLQPAVTVKRGKPNPPDREPWFEQIAGATLRRYGYPTGRPDRRHP